MIVWCELWWFDGANGQGSVGEDGSWHTDLARDWLGPEGAYAVSDPTMINLGAFTCNQSSKPLHLPLISTRNAGEVCVKLLHRGGEVESLSIVSVFAPCSLTSSRHSPATPCAYTDLHCREFFVRSAHPFSLIAEDHLPPSLPRSLPGRMADT